jgi:phosphotransferase system enzyme I (PtsI)
MTNKYPSEEINSPNKELIFHGRVVSKGIGVGKTLCLHGRKRQFYRFKIKDLQIEKEIRRFRASVRLARIQLKKISSPEVKNVGENQISIFETHRLFLEDKSLLKKIESTIIEQKVNAEWAVKVVTDNYIARYKTFSDKHLREKYIDLEDITERLLSALGGGKKSNVVFNNDTIVIAREINPSTLIEISQNNPKALITENGGWTSHTFILARELKIPAVTGVKNILRRVESGKNVIVDAYEGTIIIDPAVRTLESYRQKEDFFVKEMTEVYHPNEENIYTQDGFEVIIRANLDLSNKYEGAKKFGAKGIGLYRSEFLFNQNKGFPTELEQFENYQKIAELVGSDGIKIRTFDLGIEQIAIQGNQHEKNPALGLRGIRLSIKYENEFRIQIRALLRAAHNNNLDIVLPMISDSSEIVWVKQIVAEEQKKLAEEELNFGNPRIGSMIEVPAAVLAIDSIIKESDFLCVGTNDLVQYLLAVDRDNEDVADWFRTLHPAVIKALKLIIKASIKYQKPAIICGEMAGSPLYIPILIALGANELSMNLNFISRIRKIISNISKKESVLILEEIEKCQSSDEIEQLVKKELAEHWEHLFRAV